MVRKLIPLSGKNFTHLNREMVAGVIYPKLYRQGSGLEHQHEVLRSKTTSSRVYTRVKRLGKAQTLSEAVYTLFDHGQQLGTPPRLTIA